MFIYLSALKLMIQTVKYLKRKLVKIFINYTRSQVHGSAHVSVKFVAACDFSFKCTSQLLPALLYKQLYDSCSIRELCYVKHSVCKYLKSNNTVQVLNV